jgi:uncharacterized protein (TIGR02996 family)
MTQDEAFLQAIIESPDDEGLRLVYADWLEERGDPRGEFIRVQCRLANSPDHPQRKALKGRERELLGKHQPQWVTPLRPWVKKWGFRRGFVEDIEAEIDTVLANADKLFGVAPLRRVTFKFSLFKPGVKPLHERLAAACPYLARLSEVDWKYSTIDNLGLTALANSPHLFRLCRLSLQYARIGDEGVRALAASPAFPRLTSLVLCHNPLGSLAAESLATSTSITHLVELDLSQTEIGDAGVEALATSPNLRNLKALDLTRTAITSVGARALAGSPYLGNLEKLEVKWSRSSFDQRAMQALRERFGDRVNF